MIEVAPVVSKLLAPRGAYDEALRVEDARFNIGQAVLLQQEQEQGTNLNVQLKQAELDQVLEQKREILRVIAGAQVQLVQEQVDKWLEVEREKIRVGK